MLAKSGLFLILLFALNACSKSVPGLPTSNTIENQAASASSVYPHSNQFKMSSAHGELYLKDKALCAKCHGADLKGGNTQISCFQCHSSYPHPAEWKVAVPETPSPAHPDKFKVSGAHGAYFLKDKTLCASCHGADYKGGTSKVSCYQCHNQYPHSGNWSIPKEHGGAFLTLSRENQNQCMNCHREVAPDEAANKKPATPVSCANCHRAFPHSDEFMKGGHGKFAAQKGAQCMSCHLNVQKDLSHLNIKISCNKCHGEKFPHPENWVFSKNHGTYFAGAKKEVRDQCMVCHGSSDKPKSGPSCNGCHMAYPHGSGYGSQAHESDGRSKDGKCLACHLGLLKYVEGYSNEEIPELFGCYGCHQTDDEKPKVLKLNAEPPVMQWVLPPPPPMAPSPMGDNTQLSPNGSPTQPPEIRKPASSVRRDGKTSSKPAPKNH